MKNLLLKLAELRIVDGYIGICGVIVWLHLWAMYHTTLQVIHLSARAWKTNLFGLSVNWHTINSRNTTFSDYPPVTLRLSFLRWSYDTGREAARLTRIKCDEITAKYNARKAHDARLIEAAKLAGIEVE